jgi:O-antigen/teichoic acid export membrane protein
MSFVLFCGIPIATFLIVAAPQIIGFLYHNPAFAPSVPTLQALAPGLVFLYANSVLGALLLSLHQERKITLMALVALVFNLALNFLLIPRLEQVGAALTTSATELVLLVVSLILVPKTFLSARSLLDALRICGAAAVMGAVLWLLQAYSVVVLFLVGLVVYLCVALLCRALSVEDLRTIYGSLRRKSAARAVSQSKEAELQSGEMPEPSRAVELVSPLEGGAQ